MEVEISDHHNLFKERSVVYTHGKLEIQPCSKIQENNNKEGNYISFNGIHFAYYYSPAQKNIYSNVHLIHLGIIGEVFYSKNTTYKIWDFFNYLFSIGIKINKLYKLDVAFDTNQDIFKKVKKYSLDEERYKLKKNINSNLFKQGNNSKGVHFRSTCNDVYITIYDKTLDIKRRKKKYIAEFHLKNGLTGKVTRTELRLKGNELNKSNINVYNLCSMIKLNDQNYLMNIFNKHTDYITFCDQTKPYHDKNRNKKYKKYCILDFTNITPIEVYKKELAEIQKEIKETPTKAQKDTLHQVFIFYLDTNQTEDKLFMIRYITKNNLQAYYQKKHKDWLFLYEKTKSVAEEIRTQIQTLISTASVLSKWQV